MRFLLLISFVIGSLNAQTLKFSNGITTSKLNWQVNTFQFKPYKSYISNYSFFVGVDCNGVLTANTCVLLLRGVQGP